MSIKLKGNGLWESSRMMLPEHKEAIINQNQQTLLKTKSILDEEQLAALSEKIKQAYSMGEEVSIVMFGALQDRMVTGMITKIEVLAHKIYAAGEWINLNDILDIHGI